jgi:hypothetical protein
VLYFSLNGNEQEFRIVIVVRQYNDKENMTANGRSMDDETSILFDDVNIPQKELYKKIWGGKHISPWFFTRMAVRSSLIHAAQAASLWIQHYQRAKKKCKSAAELAFISGQYYSKTLPGPLLSIIILSAASVEAFARHCFVSTLRTRAHHKRKKEVEEKFYEFDNTIPIQRIHLIISALNADMLPTQIETEINELFSFRNGVMHGDPIYHDQDLNKRITLKSDNKEKKTVERGPRQFKYYPDLTTNSRPLSLSHGLLSTITHDKLVEHIIASCVSPSILEFLNEIGMTSDDKGLIWGDQAFHLDYKQTCQIAKEMNSINKELNKVTTKEQLQFIKELRKYKNDAQH